MSDSPRGRPVPPTQQSPLRTASKPQTQIRTGLEAPAGGWDEADTVTSFEEPVMSSKPPVITEMRDAPGLSRSRPPIANSREEIWAIVRAAVEEAVIPLVQRMRDLEVRLERAEQIARERPKLASIPVSIGAASPVTEASDTAPEAVSTLKTAGVKKPTPPLPPSVDLAAIARTDVGELEGYDGGKRKKMLGKIVVGVLLVGVLVVIVASLASQS